MMPMNEKEGKYLTFSLRGEEYGINIFKVREIIGALPVTPVPWTPDYVKGVVNLRGKVIPVVDLGMRFAMESSRYTERTCIVILEISGRARSFPVGIVVDRVVEVLKIRSADIEEPPAFGTKVNTACLLGMAKINGEIKILLDIDQILGVDEESVPSAAAGT